MQVTEAVSGAVKVRADGTQRFRYLEYFINAFLVCLLVSNLVASKICIIFGMKVSGAQLLFPLTYIFGDIFTEVYGYSASRKAIWTGFIASAVLAGMGMMVISLPAAPGWPHQAAFETVFGVVPRVVAASLIAYWCGEFCNAFVMARLKVITQGRRLWMRTIGSTAVGQAVDTVIVIVLTFAGSASGSDIWEMIRNGYLFKVAYEALATPVTYMIVNRLKRVEGVDVYDTATDFNPFHGSKRRS